MTTEFKFPNQVPPAVDRRIGDLERAVAQLRESVQVLESRISVLEAGDYVQPRRRGRPPKHA